MMKKPKTNLQKTKSKSNPQEKLLIKEHLSELAHRFYMWLMFFIVGCIIGYLNYVRLLDWLITPLHKPLFYTSPIGGFEAVFGVSALFGFVFSLPILLFEIIKFIEPVSPKFKGKKIIAYLLISLLLAIAGILTSYYLVFPASLEFLGKFGSDQLESLISTKDYFSFVTRYLLGFAILFQLPLVIYLISLFTPVSAKFLLKQFKYVFALSFLIAAILTPTPDLVNQTIMATPIIALYLLTILILFVKQHIGPHTWLN